MASVGVLVNYSLAAVNKYTSKIIKHRQPGAWFNILTRHAHNK